MREAIPGPADRLDQPWVSTVAFDLAPQSADLDIDGAVERPGIVSMQVVHELVATHRRAGLAQEGGEDVEFAPGETQLLAFATGDRAGIEVHAQPVDVQRPGAARERRAAASHCMDARQQLAQIERLGDEIVGAELKPDRPFRRIAAAADDQQRALPAGAQLAQCIQPVTVRQAKVQQQDIERLAGLTAKLAGAAHDTHLHPTAGEVAIEAAC